MKNLAVMNDHVFHLVTLHEYILSRGEDVSDWRVVIYHNTDLPELKKMCTEYLEEASFRSYEFVDYRLLKKLPKLATITVQVLSIMRYLLFRARQLTYHTVAIGNYASRVCQSVASFTRSEELVYIDEGYSTLGVAKTRSQPAANLSTFRKLIRRLPTLRGNKKVTFFTRYIDLTFAPADRVILCDYSHTLRRKDDSSVDASTVIFLGNPFVQKAYVSEQHYLAALTAIYTNYRRQGIELRYKPHRSEDTASLQKITAIGIDVVSDAWPIELYLSRLERFPHHIASFVTSALATISTLFGDQLSLVSYEFTHEATSDFEEYFREMYQYYRDNEATLHIDVRSIPYTEPSTADQPSRGTA